MGTPRNWNSPAASVTAVCFQSARCALSDTVAPGTGRCCGSCTTPRTAPTVWAAAWRAGSTSSAVTASVLSTREITLRAITGSGLWGGAEPGHQDTVPASGPECQSCSKLFFSQAPELVRDGARDARSRSVIDGFSSVALADRVD